MHKTLFVMKGSSQLGQNIVNMDKGKYYTYILYKLTSFDIINNIEIVMYDILNT